MMDESLTTFYWPISSQWSISIPPENVRKTDFLTFSGGIEMECCLEMGWATQLAKLQENPPMKISEEKVSS